MTDPAYSAERPFLHELSAGFVLDRLVRLHEEHDRGDVPRPAGLARIFLREANRSANRYLAGLTNAVWRAQMVRYATDPLGVLKDEHTALLRAYEDAERMIEAWDRYSAARGNQVRLGGGHRPAGAPAVDDLDRYVATLADLHDAHLRDMEDHASFTAGEPF